MEQIKPLIKGNIGRDIIYLETVDSTNRAAIEIADNGALHGTVVIADCQTKGRGRLGRTWVSPPASNIYMSIILRPNLEPEDATLLTIMASVASARALRNATGLPVGIKWPNDLIVHDKKLGGILSETRSINSRIIFSVIGIGININSGLEDFPPDLRTVATSIKNETGREESRVNLIANILNEMDCWLKGLSKDGKEHLLAEWRRLTLTLKKSVKAVVGKDTFTGIAEDIDDKGMLLLRLPSGVLKKISAGDVTILR